MPLVEVTLVEGRSGEQIRTLITKLTDAVETAAEAPRANIRVIVREVPATHWAAATSPSRRDARPDDQSNSGSVWVRLSSKKCG